MSAVLVVPSSMLCFSVAPMLTTASAQVGSSVQMMSAAAGGDAATGDGITSSAGTEDLVLFGRGQRVAKTVTIARSAASSRARKGAASGGSARLVPTLPGTAH
jgi:hypothetical protein